MREYKLLINGNWVDSSTKEIFENINPTAPDKPATFHIVSEADIGFDRFEAALKRAIS